MMGGSTNNTSTYAYVNFRGENGFEGEEVDLDFVDVYTLSTEELLDKYEIEGTFNRLQVGQIHKLNTAGGGSITYIAGQLIWGLLLLVPLISLVLKLLYVRRKKRYVEHLIFSLHVHSFAFILLIISMGSLWWFGSGVLLWLALIIFPIYLYLAMLWYYRQNWFKTLIKFFVTTILYMVVINFSLVISLLVSMAMF
ncbi:MAG: hypothetical protein AAFU03_13830, partial [Bacteroidota bacterium]